MHVKFNYTPSSCCLVQVRVVSSSCCSVWLALQASAEPVESASKPDGSELVVGGTLPPAHIVAMPPVGDVKDALDVATVLSLRTISGSIGVDG